MLDQIKFQCCIYFVISKDFDISYHVKTMIGWNNTIKINWFEQNILKNKFTNSIKLIKLVYRTKIFFPKLFFTVSYMKFLLVEAIFFRRYHVMIS